MKLLYPIQKYIETLNTAILSEERKTVLQPLADYINLKIPTNQIIQLNFICTHNSRRSHLAQVWAQTLSEYFNVPNIQCYSGGTEATQVHPMVIKTLENCGFEISKERDIPNPNYKIRYAKNKSSLVVFSKKYDDEINPKNSFAAIMTCSQADEGCPFVAGSEKRISIMYEDPKVADGTPQQQQIYKERSEQIAVEMKYVFSRIVI